VQRSDGPALYAGHKNSIRIILVLLNKVARRLLGGDSDEGDTLVRRLEPHNLGLLLLTGLRVASVATLTGSPLSLLLLLGSLAAGSEKTQGAREHLTSNTFNDSHNVTSIQRLLLIVDFLLLNKQKALTFDLDIIVLLLSRALAQTTATTNAALRGVTLVVVTRVLVALVGRSRSGISDILALLLLFLLALLAPDFINIQKLDRDEITLKSTVSVLATADEDVGIEKTILSSDVGIATVLLVDTKDTRHELAIAEKGGERGLGKVRSEKGLALLLLLLASELAGMLRALKTHELLAVQLSGLQSL
jgi:hypothetical protein